MDQVLPMKRDVVLFVALLLAAVIVGVLFLLSLNNTYRQQLIGLQSQNNTPGFNEGVLMSVMSLVKSTDNCQVASIKYFNVSRRLVDIDCVRALLQQQNITLRGG